MIRGMLLFMFGIPRRYFQMKSIEMYDAYVRFHGSPEGQYRAYLALSLSDFFLSLAESLLDTEKRIVK